MKFKYLLINLFVLAAITAFSQTEGEQPQTEPGEPNPSDTTITEKDTVASHTPFVGPVQETTHNDYGTKESNPHHSEQRLKYGVKHNSVYYGFVKNPHLSLWVPEDWTHNNYYDSYFPNPHYSTYHPSDLTVHNDYMPFGGLKDGYPHYSSAVRKGDVHNNRPSSYNVENPHASTYSPKNFIHNGQVHLRIHPSSIANPDYSLMVSPRHFKHVVKIGTLHHSKVVYRGSNKSDLKDIDELELDIINPGRIALSIFPNPSTDKVTFYPIHIADFINNATIQIFDVLGKKVLTETIYQNNNNSYQIDISTLKTGTYLTQVVFNNQTVMNGKFIKQ